jgi:phosphoribosylformimino-5-aminoimidazole carboxamide ribonucleotide (ProFAR) isomerase
VRGWEKGSGRDLLDVAREFADAGVEALIVTEIGRDGTLAGPDLDGLTEVLDASALPVIASGGVGTLHDLHRLAALRSGERSLSGAIVGRALYEGAFSLSDALAASAS